MAEEISELCRQYAFDHVGEYDGESEDEAVIKLAAAIRNYTKEQGWEEADFHMDVEALAREVMRQHRSEK